MSPTKHALPPHEELIYSPLQRRKISKSESPKQTEKGGRTLCYWNQFLALIWNFLTKYGNRNSISHSDNFLQIIKIVETERNDFVIFLVNKIFWAYIFRSRLNYTFHWYAHLDFSNLSLIHWFLHQQKAEKNRIRKCILTLSNFLGEDFHILHRI